MFFLAQSIIILTLVVILVSCKRRPIFQKFRPNDPKKILRPFENAGSKLGKAFELPALKSGTSPVMTMGMRPLNRDNWLTIDDHYLPEHAIRSSQLSQARSSVLQCLPGSESACQEVLSEVSSFLAARYPTMFVLSSDSYQQVIRNLKTGEQFPLTNNLQPLETAARLAMEDFNVLMKDPTNGEYRLQASATLFPAGWRLEERIGFTLAELHCPVPAWREKIGSSVNRYLDHLSAKTAMERHTLFVQTNPDLFQNESLCSSTNASSLASEKGTSIQEPGSTGGDDLVHDAQGQASPPHSPLPQDLRPSEIYVRRERQTFVRLRRSNAVLFTVRTYMKPLTSLGDEELAALLEIVGRWSDEMAAYKGRGQWWDVVRQYQEARRASVSREA